MKGTLGVQDLLLFPDRAATVTECIVWTDRPRQYHADRQAHATVFLSYSPTPEILVTITCVPA